MWGYRWKWLNLYVRDSIRYLEYIFIRFIFLHKRKYFFIIENVSISCEAAYKLSKIRHGLSAGKSRNTWAAWSHVVPESQHHVWSVLPDNFFYVISFPKKKESSYVAVYSWEFGSGKNRFIDWKSSLIIRNLFNDQ